MIVGDEDGQQKLRQARHRKATAADPVVKTVVA
jgi:hypothetical protein